MGSNQGGSGFYIKPKARIKREGEGTLQSRRPKVNKSALSRIKRKKKD